MTKRVTAAIIAERVAKCRYRLVYDKNRPVAFAQGETSRGEPRWNYVCCQQGDSTVFSGNACKCADPEGFGDNISAATAERRAHYVIIARAFARAEEQERKDRK